MGEGVKLGGIFERLGREGVGDGGEEEGTWMGVGGMLRFTNAGAVDLPGAFAGHFLLLRLLSFGVLLVILSPSL